MLWLHVQMALLDSARAVVSFAANWLLQSTLLIAAGLAVAWLLGRGRSALQSAIYRTTLAAVIVCPLATALLSRGGVSGWSVELPVAWTYEEQTPLVNNDAPKTVAGPFATAAENSMPLEPARLSTSPAPNTTFRSEPSGERLSNARANAGLGGQPPSNTPVLISTRSNAVTSTQTFLAKTALFEVRAFGLAAIGVSLTWLAVSAVLLCRLTGAWRRLGKLRRAAVTAEPATQQACRELAALLAVAAPQVRRTPYLASPCLAGLLRPVVLLPEAEASLPLRDVLIHELAHQRRRDGWWNLLTRLAEALFFYQPLLWTLARRLESAAEEVCDDYVVQLGGDREDYARGLLEIAERSLAPVGMAGVAMVSLRSILARRVTRIVDSSRRLSTRAGNLVLALVIAGGLVGATAVGLVGLGPRPSLADAQPTSDAAAKNRPESEAEKTAAEDNRRPAAAAEKPNTSRKKTEPPSDKQLEGRVVGADGKSVAGAKIYWIRSRIFDLKPEPPRLMATTGDDGRFRFAERPAVSEDTPASWNYSDRVVIKAPGHGFAFLSPSEIRGAATRPDGIIAAQARSVTGDGGPTSLRAEGEPIRGRLVDINGQPVVGATVRIRWFGEEGDRLELLKEAEARGLEYAVWQARAAWLLNVIEPVQLRDVLPSATTDTAGRFELRGIGAKRLVQLLVEGEGIESSEVVARNEPGEKIVIEADANRDSFALYPNEFVHAIGPSTPVEGRVLDLDTGEPIADAVVRAVVVHGQRITTSREREHFATTTDAQGHYRIAGLPIGDGNKLVAFATGSVAYVPVGHTAETSAAHAVIQDFRLKRGVWAEGRVFDAETRKPVTGEISYYFLHNRDLEQAIPGLRHVYIDGLYWTNANGDFRVPVLPSRGILAFRYDGNAMDRSGIDRYARGFGADEIAGSEPFGGDIWFPTEPHYLIPTNYERIAEVPATEGQETVRVEMPLSASHPAVVRVVDSQGEPVIQFQAYGANERWGWQNQEGPQFEIQDLRPGERRKVFVFHRGRKLAGGGFVEFGAEQAVEIRLVKAGSVHGRLVDADGAPIDDATLSVNLEKLRSSDNSAIWARHPDLQANPEKIPVDKEGRFRLDGLIPGWTYHAHASAPRPLQGQTVNIIIGSPLKGVHVEAGENKDLGDLVVGADKPGSDDDSTKDASAETKPAASETAEEKIVRGRVLLPDGRPARGAHVAVIARRTAVKRGGDFGRGDEVLAKATANENGEYSMTLADVSQKTHANANVIARQDGAAIAWRQLNLDNAETEADLELTDEELVRGKLIDVEGRPARGVQLSVVSVAARTENVHDARGVGYHGRDKTPSAWLAAITSDAQGRFVLHGLAANHGVTLEVAGDDRFAKQDILLNTGAQEQRGKHDKTYRPLVKNVTPGEEAGLVLAPAQLFEGTVRYADTGQGVPHARITIWASQEQLGSMMSVAGRTDERGHYRISPRPGIRFGVAAYPPDGTAYLARETPPDKAIEWKAIEGAKQVDLTLPRGVLVRGTVVEAGSGAPVAGAAVQYLPESLNNRNASNDILTGWQTIQLSDGDGRFTMAVLPGPGRLLVNGPQGKYVLQEIGNRELYSGKPGGARYYVHAHAKLNPEAGQDAVEVKLELEPGATARGRIVDEAGKAIDEALVISRLDISPLSLFWRAHTTPTLGGRYELSGLAEGVEYTVYFLDPKRRLGATEVIKAGDNERTVVLKPCGTATMRLIDGEGEPMPANYGSFEMVVTPGAARYDREALERGELSSDAEFIANIDRMNNPISPGDDETGARTMNALIPGAIYRIIAKRDGEIRIVKEFQVKPNEAVDFGDIVVERD